MATLFDVDSFLSNLVITTLFDVNLENNRVEQVQNLVYYATKSGGFGPIKARTSMSLEAFTFIS